MVLSVLVTPFSDRNLRLAAQAGAEGIVITYPGLELEELLKTCKKVESYGLKVAAVERLIPHSKFVHNLPGRDQQIEDFKKLIHNMGKADIPILCYNWMPKDDWGRTEVDLLERGGAKVTGFNIDSPNIIRDEAYEVPEEAEGITSEDELWNNLEYFLQQVLPVAEKAGVKLAMHPDDPPISSVNGQPSIMTRIEEMEKLVKLFPSSSNTICLCQGTFASRGDVDIAEAVKRLAPHISYVHFRDVVGSVPNFRESFIDNGKTDVVKTMRAYLSLEQSENICIRPDHVPTLAGETNEHPGYEMLGRLHAIGYMKGLMDAILDKNRSVIQD